MLRRRIAGWAMLGAILCVAAPLPAHAQIGGMIKKKVKQAVKGEVTGGDTAAAPGARPAAAPSGPRFSEDVLELTPETLDRFQRGLVAEQAFRDSIEASYAKMKTPAQYEQCKVDVIRSPEGQKIGYVDAGNRQAMLDAGQKLLGLIQQRCGTDPGSRNKGADLNGAADRGSSAAGFSGAAYGVIKERVTPFCGTGGGTARIAGSGSGIYYVYSETEIAALQPRCAKLMALLDTGPRTVGRQMKH